MVPASNVLAPVDVMRTRSKAPPSAIKPPVIHINSPEVSPHVPLADQVLLVTLVIIIFPLTKAAAVALFNVKPVVNVAAATDEAPSLAPPPL